MSTMVFAGKVNAGPAAATAMPDTQLIENHGGVEAGVIAQLVRDHFGGFGEIFEDAFSGLPSFHFRHTLH
jgi:hypothetical protein